MELSGAVALVTGGARRLGRELALALADAGADVAIAHHGSDADADDVLARIRGLGRRAVALAGDLADPATPDRLVRKVVADLGRLDVLVNNAARFDSANIETIDARQWDRVMAVNLRAPFLLSRAAAPHLREHEGLIVNIADLAAFQPWPRYAHHAVSKAGLVHLTRVLARAFAPDVRVNCIAPGTVLPPEDWSEDEIAEQRARIPLARIGKPADVSRALLYLARADFVTGEVMIVDGGRLLT